MSLELADLHNRRANIETVANLARVNGTPFLTWPEDKELLRLADLPRITRVNIPVNWVKCEPVISFVVTSDQSLRDIIVIGRAYSVNPALQQFNGVYVQEWKIETR